jgi:hypothetical protein
MKVTLLASALATAMVVTAVPSFGQMAAPTMLNVVHYRVKLDHIQEFQEVERQIAGSYKKAAPTDQFRIIYRGTVGNATEFDVFTPMSKFADRDGENPYNKMTTEQERLTRGARLNQYLENVQTSIDKPIAELSINTAGAPFPPAHMHGIRVRVRSGSADEFSAVMKNELIPAIKKEGVKTLLARRTLLGGVIDDYNFAEGFEKWAEMDTPDTLPKVMGEEAFRKMITKINAVVTLREDTVWTYQADLSYYPGAGATTSSR